MKLFKYSLLILLLAAPAAFAAGPATGAASANSTANVTIKVPGVVGIDVESELQWDFNNPLSAPASGYTFQVTYTPGGAASSGACPANTWPPPAGCTGNAVYTPSTNITAGAPAGTSGDVWLAVFSTKNSVPDVQTSMAAVTLGSILETSFTHQAGTINNTVNTGTFGKAAATAFSTTPTSILQGAAPAAGAFGWTRIDQAVRLSVPGTTTFTSGTASTTITYTISG